jgi:acyl carrier protein
MTDPLSTPAPAWTPAAARAVVADVLAEIAPEVDLAEVPPDADLREEADLDSMDFLSLVAGVHERTGIDVPEADYAAVRSLDGFVGYLVAHGTR